MPARLCRSPAELASSTATGSASPRACLLLGRSTGGIRKSPRRGADSRRRWPIRKSRLVGVGSVCPKTERQLSSRAQLGSQALAPYADWSGVPVTALGYDLENARTIVSFGAPLLDGWGTPGRFTRLWSERAAGSTDPQLRLIQVEAS